MLWLIANTVPILTPTEKMQQPMRRVLHFWNENSGNLQQKCGIYFKYT